MREFEINIYQKNAFNNEIYFNNFTINQELMKSIELSY